jgi:hypothetical protein
VSGHATDRHCAGSPSLRRLKVLAPDLQQRLERLEMFLTEQHLPPPPPPQPPQAYSDVLEPKPAQKARKHKASDVKASPSKRVHAVDDGDTEAAAATALSWTPDLRVRFPACTRVGVRGPDFVQDSLEQELLAVLNTGDKRQVCICRCLPPERFTNANGGRAQLKALDVIGDKTADKILEYRSKERPISTVRNLSPAVGRSD